MSRHLKERVEKILQVLERLIEESKKGIPILVEGKRDIKALREAGVEGRIISVKTGGKSFQDVIFEIEKSTVQEVILLLDFDRRGKEGTKRIKQDLEKIRVKTNIKFWCKFLKLAGRELKDIESLKNYMETLKSKVCISQLDV